MVLMLDYVIWSAVLVNVKDVIICLNLLNVCNLANVWAMRSRNVINK